MKKILATFVFFMMNAASADELGFSVGPNWSTMSRDGAASSVSYTSKTSYYFGANIAYTLVPDTFDIEGDLEYWKRSYESTVGGITLADSVKYLALPVLGRYWVTEYLVLGAGLYYAIGMGNVDRTVTFSGVSTSSSISMTDANYLNSDFGFVFDLKTRFAVDENWRVLLGVRYVLGISDVDNFTASTSHFRDLRGIASIAYEL